MSQTQKGNKYIVACQAHTVLGKKGANPVCGSFLLKFCVLSLPGRFVGALLARDNI